MGTSESATGVRLSLSKTSYNSSPFLSNIFVAKPSLRTIRSGLGRSRDTYAKTIINANIPTTIDAKVPIAPYNTNLDLLKYLILIVFKYIIYDMNSKKKKKILSAIIIIASLALIAGTFLPY